MDETLKAEMLREANLKHSKVPQFIRECYQMLGWQVFFTAGEKETRAWMIEKSATARDAARAIHSDFADKFIAVEVCSFGDFIQNNGWSGAKSVGKVRVEGADYKMRDGDVCVFKHNN